jgi:hypothetical protein
VTANVQIIHQPDLFSDGQAGYHVRAIDPRETHPFILDVHYAHRLPAISYAFGLIRDGELVGIVTYGKPASHTLCQGVCGIEWSSQVLELNRLCLLDNQTNEASRLVGASLRLLPKPTVVVSYADTAQDHLGVIYQATNFIYTGTTTARDEWYVEGDEQNHSRQLFHLASNTELGGLAGLREMFGERLKTRPRSVKHRYIYFVAGRTDRRHLFEALRYPIQPYPKRGSDA